MMNAEVLAFVLYFVLMLAIGVFFFFKERVQARRNISLAAAIWARGSRQ